ncbi:hypothetical protein EG328_012034 [Venturia inaequalis]|uniref:DUF7703 domain-containing protein n=1 Tax=Venturia inaequalis TaxID=5025 RepID=A0A8H3Z5V0_VENIN|nr:hypothetical protein EG328_012034 [Venturia inaequalis]
MSTNTTSLPFVALSKYNWSLSHFTTLPYNPLVYSLLSSFFAISLYLTLDLLIQIHLKFKKYTGLYYFSILATTVGIGMHAIAFILKLFVPGMADDGLNSLAANLASTAVAKIGWVLNTTGFSMVLWSRLGLVIRDGRIRTWTLCIIILDAILLHTPIIVFSFGLSTPSAREWLPYMSHMERIQIIGFTLQDLALSTFYTISSARLLDIRYTKQRRNLFIALAFAQLFGLVADSVMVAGSVTSVLAHLTVVTLSPMYPTSGPFSKHDSQVGKEEKIEDIEAEMRAYGMSDLIKPTILDEGEFDHYPPEVRRAKETERKMRWFRSPRTAPHAFLRDSKEYMLRTGTPPRPHSQILSDRSQRISGSVEEWRNGFMSHRHGSGDCSTCHSLHQGLGEPQERARYSDI